MGDEFNPYHKWLGIPLKDQPADLYRLLGVERFEEDPDVITGAADQRMQYLRTLQSGERAKTSQQLLNEVAAARVCLLDAAKKANYDAELKQQIADQKTPTPAAETPSDSLAATLEFTAPKSAPVIKTESTAESDLPDWKPKNKSAKERAQIASTTVGRKTKARVFLLLFLASFTILLFLTVLIAGVGRDQGKITKREVGSVGPTTSVPIDDRGQSETDKRDTVKEEDSRKAEAEIARVEAERIAKEKAEAERKAKEKAEAERIAKEKAEQRAKEVARRIAEAETERQIKRESERRTRQEAERKANEEKYLRDWFQRNFEQTKTGWTPRIHDDLQKRIEDLKKSKNKLAKSLLQSQSLLRAREKLTKTLRNAEKAKKDFKPKKEAATSRLQRIKKIERDLSSAQSNIDANSKILKVKRNEIVIQLRAFHGDIQACRTQNKKITSLLDHPYTHRFVKANGLQLAVATSPEKLKREMVKADKLLKKTREVQRSLEAIK